MSSSPPPHSDPATNPQPEEEEPPTSQDLARAEYKSYATQHSRLALTPVPRITLATSIAAIVGASMGLTHGSSTAGLRFRAENAHRLPASQTGWYLYHKSKNYSMMLGGVKEGGKMGLKLGGWVAAFFLIENMWDEVRGTMDFGNTVLASLATAGGFAAWNRFPIQTAAKTARNGLLFGLVFGLAQDAVGVMRGRRPGYVEFVLRAGGRHESGNAVGAV